jgi:hypothetical protein
MDIEWPFKLSRLMDCLASWLFAEFNGRLRAVSRKKMFILVFVLVPKLLLSIVAAIYIYAFDVDWTPRFLTCSCVLLVHFALERYYWHGYSSPSLSQQLNLLQRPVEHTPTVHRH